MYFLIRSIWLLGIKGFFRRIEVEGREKLPQDGGVLFVSNHLNAFVDGILLVTMLERPLRVTAKATLKKNPLFRFLLNGVRAVTFQRVEDGESQAGNASALAEVVSALQQNEQVLIFPEGFSHSEGRLRPFKKGAAKVALELATNNPQFHVIPVGLVYLEKDRFRSDVLLRFGTPLDAKKILSHPDVEALNGVLRHEVASLSLELPPKELREYTWVAQAVLAGERTPTRLGQDPHPLSDLVREIALMKDLRTQASKEAFEEAKRVALRLYAMTGQGGIRPEELSLPLSGWRALVFFLRELEIVLLSILPGTWGLINLLPAYLLSKYLVRKTAQEDDHVATHSVFLGTPIFFLFLFLQTLLAAWVVSWCFAVVYLITMPFFATIALLCFDRLREAKHRLRSFCTLLRMRQGREEIYQVAESLRHFKNQFQKG